MMQRDVDVRNLVAAGALGLPQVRTKRLFAADAFFVGGRMFAFLRDDAVVLRLPAPERERLIEAGVGRPFLVGPDAPFGRWLEIVLGSGGAARALRLVRLAYDAALSADADGPRRRRRSGPRRRPARR